MRVVREWLHRLAGTLLRRRCDTDLEEEVRLHLEMATEDARSRGLEPADAVCAAQVKTGAASHAMDALRDQRGLPWLDDLARDVSHAANVHFDDRFEGNTIAFDYVMKPGPVIRSNALALMRAVGLDVQESDG